MKNYILMRRGVKEHFFTTPSGGIYMHSQKNSFWTPPVSVCTDAVSDFGLYKDMHENVHIVCADRGGSLIYTLIRGEKVTHHIILASKPTLSLSDFFIKAYNGLLNLFYIALVDGEKLLIHCLLGNNAQPSVISELCEKYFFIHDNRVYYSNKSNTLGYSEFADGKPSQFIPLFENSCSPYILGSGKNKHSTWLCRGCIMLDGAEAVHDEKALRPILTDADTLMWEQNDIVHYATIRNDGSMSAPMRFIPVGKVPELFCVQNYDDFRYYYGTHYLNEVNLFGKSDIFEHHADAADTAPQSGTDIQRLKIIVDMVQKEVASIKQQLKIIKQMTETK